MGIAGTQDNGIAVPGCGQSALNVRFRGVFGRDKVLSTEVSAQIAWEGCRCAGLVANTGGPIVGAAAEEGLFIDREASAPDFGHGIPGQGLCRRPVFGKIAETGLCSREELLLIAQNARYGFLDFIQIQLARFARFQKGLGGGLLQVKGCGKLCQVHTGLNGGNDAIGRAEMVLNGSISMQSVRISP